MFPKCNQSNSRGGNNSNRFLFPVNPPLEPANFPHGRLHLNLSLNHQDPPPHVSRNPSPRNHFPRARFLFQQDPCLHVSRNLFPLNRFPRARFLSHRDLSPNLFQQNRSPHDRPRLAKGRPLLGPCKFHPSSREVFRPAEPGSASDPNSKSPSPRRSISRHFQILFGRP